MPTLGVHSVQRLLKWHNSVVEIKQLESTKGFVIYDVPNAETYVGPTRLGAKLAPGNAEMLVRHQTYVFALNEERKSGVKEMHFEKRQLSQFEPWSMKLIHCRLK